MLSVLTLTCALLLLAAARRKEKVEGTLYREMWTSLKVRPIKWCCQWGYVLPGSFSVGCSDIFFVIINLTGKLLFWDEIDYWYSQRASNQVMPLCLPSPLSLVHKKVEKGHVPVVKREHCWSLKRNLFFRVKGLMLEMSDSLNFCSRNWTPPYQLVLYQNFLLHFLTETI